MGALFDGGRVVDLVLLLMAAELAVLSALHGRGRFPVPPRLLIPNFLAGACLLMALRAALTHSGAAQCSAWLLLGLAAHLLDVATRARGVGRR